LDSQRRLKNDEPRRGVVDKNVSVAVVFHCLLNGRVNGNQDLLLPEEYLVMAARVSAGLDEGCADQKQNRETN
jgi:hypothetical protein